MQISLTGIGLEIIMPNDWKNNNSTTGRPEL